MPLPTDKVLVSRTFRQCATDPSGVVYHTNMFAQGSGLWVFEIVRGSESLECILAAPSVPEAQEALKRGPVFHGMPSLAVGSKKFRWSYDQFGDCVFSMLKSGAYRDAGAKEWGTDDVFLDCIDEIRRIIGIPITVEKARIVPSNTFGKSVRKLIL
ncbi:hypothetical protein OpiT1DRAFT_05662 [Opitutaceae bacterium TAV1]|nr:hypothetical protein OpiT1DRAFT_05662 [Opitutaceae bacterium TAV1]